MSLSADRLVRVFFPVLLLSAMVLAAGCATSSSKSDFAPEEPVYLKVNIHYQYNGNDNKASYANYTAPGEGHKILHVNTPVKIEGWRNRGFKIIDTQNKEEIFFEYNHDRMEMTKETYLSHITSPGTVSLADMSDIDKKGIEDGKAYMGMTKDGVMMALGYPATHKTPSPEENTWTYWTNRFGTLEVVFDNNGIVTDIID